MKIGLMSWSENEKIHDEIIKRLEKENLKCIIANEDDDLDVVFADCRVIVTILTEDQNDKNSIAHNILTDFVSNKKRIIAYFTDKLEEGGSLDFLTGGETAVFGNKDEKNIPEKLFDIIIAQKDYKTDWVEKRQEVSNFRKIKLSSRPFGVILITFLFVQLLAVSVWLASMISEYFLGLSVLIIAAFIYICIWIRKRCSYKGCKEKFEGVKNIYRKGSTKSQKLKFCHIHLGETQVSEKKTSFNAIYPIVAFMTMLFVVLFATGAVTTDDFLFLDLRKRMDDNKPIEFSDSGFELFVRNEFGFEKGGIAKIQLKDIEELKFNAESCNIPIETLEDLKYFPNLRTLDSLSVNHISGTFEDLLNAPLLEHIHIGSANISGDIATLSKLEYIATINIDAHRQRNDITGDIASLKNCEYLGFLGLPNTAVYGDIAYISNLGNLGSIFLDNTDVSGDISALKDMTWLMEIFLGGTNVEGDIEALQNLTELQHIALEGQLITGDIAKLANLENLLLIYLWESNVYGDIKVLEKLKKTEDVMLAGSHNITGDIAVLEGLTHLNRFDMYYTQVYGDVEVFRGKKCSSINLDGTGVYGSLDVFANNPNLADLILYLNNVSGDVGVLEGLNLCSFGANENIYGDLEAFAQMENLWQLSIGNSNISGDVSCLVDLKNLQQLEFDGSLVSDEANGIYVKDLNILGNMIESVVFEHHIVHRESLEDIKQNSGASFGYTDKKDITDEGIVLASSEERQLPLLFKMDGFPESDMYGNQALYIKFKPSSNNMGFLLNGNMDNGGRFRVDFINGVPLLVIETDDMEMPVDTGFVLEEDQWYHLFVGLGRGGDYVCIIWKDRCATSACRIEFSGEITFDESRYQNQAWDFSFTYAQPFIITVSQYDVYKFSNFN